MTPDPTRCDPQVDAWLATLDHPDKDVISAVRKVVLEAQPDISEGIKWNACSFRTVDWFATFHVRGPKGPKPVTLVLHFGAKVRPWAVDIEDPTGLLTWQSTDRATITFSDLDDFERKAKALPKLVRVWLATMGKR